PSTTEFYTLSLHDDLPIWIFFTVQVAAEQTSNPEAKINFLVILSFALRRKTLPCLCAAFAAHKAWLTVMRVSQVENCESSRGSPKCWNGLQEGPPGPCLRNRWSKRPGSWQSRWTRDSAVCYCVEIVRLRAGRCDT